MDKNEIKRAAHGRWPSILATLGVPSEYLSKHHRACPFCGGKDRYRFDDKHGDGNWYCTHCGSNDGFAFVSLFKHLDFPNTLRLVAPLIVNATATQVQRDPEVTEEKLNSIWRAAAPIVSGDPVHQYLKGRGIVMDEYPTSLRCHPALPYYDNGVVSGYYAAMLGQIVTPEGKLVAIHRTYLSRGKKAEVASPKKVYGKTGCGCQIRLREPGGRLCLTEGIETGLAVMLMNPQDGVYSCVSASSLQAFKGNTEHLAIYADNDSSFVGQCAAYQLARRCVEAGGEASVHVPEQKQSDWADLWHASCNHIL